VEEIAKHSDLEEDKRVLGSFLKFHTTKSMDIPVNEAVDDDKNDIQLVLEEGRHTY
jgi:hypothetical protein